jgi:outer membrane lipoprotein
VVLENPSAHLGEMVVWGGIIVGNVSRPDGAQVVVLEKPLSVRGRPLGEAPRGRFIARASGPLDRDSYDNGKEITVAGKIVGFEGKPPGAVEPVVMITESYVWPTGDHPPGGAQPWWWKADTNVSLTHHGSPFRYTEFYYAN